MNLNTIELSELLAFVRVVQSRSFTRAAEVLNSQKARLSRSVTQLEHKLGVRLIERTTRSLSLTEVGREVFERAVGILNAVEDTERVAAQMLAEPRGVLKLTCGVEFGMIAVSDWIDQYLQRYPLVTVEADFTGRVVDLVHEGFDLAIRIGELTDSRLASRTLGHLEYGLYASPSYLARRGCPDHPAELAQHETLVFNTPQHRGQWTLTRGGEEQTVVTRARMRVNNSFAVRDAAQCGLGVALLPLVVARDAENEQLRRILPDWQPASVPVHVVFPSLRYLTPKVRQFIDLAVANFPGMATSA